MKYSNKEYELDITNIRTYMGGIAELQSLLHIWPPMDQVENMGTKTTLIENLDFVAATKTKSKRPTTRPLNLQHAIPHAIVIKRTHSDCGQHVLFPGDELRNVEYLQSQMDIPGSMWFGQSYISTLREFGEWRVFIIGGRIIEIIHTKIHEETGLWKWQRAIRFWSLEELR